MLDSILANPLSLLVGIVCLGMSILVHELGHYLAARWRGVVATRFSIGFGPRICGWTDRRGTEFRLSWIPLGGYVALPQLADMGELEGSEGAEAKQLPPIGYLDKVIVSVAGAFFNVLFALALASVLWIAGQEVGADEATTKIGYVSPTIKLSDGREFPSPAAQAGLQIGDVIRSIDGRRTTEWQDVLEGIVFGSGSVDGKRTVVFVIERSGQPLTIALTPLLASEEKVRRIGIAAFCEPKVHAVTPDSPGAKVGFVAEDRFESIDGVSIRSFATLDESLKTNAKRPLLVRVLRAGQPVDVELPAGTAAGGASKLGVLFTTDSVTVHVDPFTQIAGHIHRTIRTLWSLINPRSDIGLDKMGGPIGIIANFSQAAQAGVLVVIWMTILINIALAVFNLLPIPVLDGGHVVFATIAKVRGRPLPINVVASLQMTFVVLLFSMMLYVSFFDVRRLTRDHRPAAEEKQPEKQPAPATSPAEPAPAKP